MENDQTSRPDSNYVKEKLDQILEKNFRKLDQIDVLGNSLPLDMVTVASLHLLAERENEVEEEEKYKKQRYNKTTLLNDLSEIGFEIDEDLMKKIQTVIDKGYVEVNAEDGYHVRPDAMEIVNNINRMYPGMPGMNLIAYVLQTLEEIVSGRKDCDNALEQYDKALISRGRMLTFVYLRTEKKTEKQKAEDRIKRAIEREESRKASEKLKVIYSEKIAKLRESLTREKEDPIVVSRRVLGADEIHIKEISPHKIREAKEKERAEKEREQREQLEREREELELKRIELERLAKEQAENERIEWERAEKLRIEQETREKVEREVAERLKQEKEEEARREREREEQERLVNERKNEELAIEQQIAAFENQQASICPLCHQGRIVKEVTESNREYYRCDSRACKFISWDKPHPYACPKCGNPYLLEFQRQDGSLGLKCPLATCSYMQNDLRKPEIIAPPPGAPVAIQSPDGVDQPKKKRLVRRRRS